MSVRLYGRSFVLKGGRNDHYSERKYRFRIVVSAPACGRLDVTEHGYLIAENGVITGVYPVLPEQYAGASVEDYGDCLIVQSFADLHLHAPQYPMLGMGMDLPLLDWLNAYAFPTEARFAERCTGSWRGNWRPTGPRGCVCFPLSTPTLP